MKKTLPVEFMDERLNERLAKTGLRFTAQRRRVYSVLLEKGDHPSAEEVFIRAKGEMPDISMATVYNCLDTLVRCGLVRQVKVERGPVRYCSNMREHHHFHCDECGGTFDVDLHSAPGDLDIETPAGFRVRCYEVTFHGACPECGRRSAPSETRPLTVAAAP